MKKMDYNNYSKPEKKGSRSQELSRESREALEELKYISTLEQFSVACEECQIRLSFTWQMKKGDKSGNH